jgi:ERCC4-related helicase
MLEIGNDQNENFDSLGYDSVGIAFKELNQNTQEISADMSRILADDRSQVEIFNSLENYISNMSKYITQAKPEPTYTKKILKLKGIVLDKIKVKDQKILVFCQMKVITRYLSDYLNKTASEENPDLKAGYIIGKGKMINNASDIEKDEVINVAQIHGYVDIYKQSEESKKETNDLGPEVISETAKRVRTKIKKNFDNDSMNLEGQKNAVKDFRENKINVLVATGVVEEGFDIPSCNVVISFDELLNIKQYIQIKGRARMKNSQFYIFAHESRVCILLL